MTTLNNKLVYVATSTDAGTHKGDYDGSCGLSPDCKLKWRKGSKIGRVRIEAGSNHPKAGVTTWACVHHSLASATGFKFEIQKKLRASTRINDLKTKKQEEKKERLDRAAKKKEKFKTGAEKDAGNKAITEAK